MATTTTSVADRVAAWRDTLSPWLACLASHLSLSIDSLLDRDAIARRLWIRFTVPEQPQSVLVRATGQENQTWCTWLEALELLDLLARLDAAACWTLVLHDLCDVSASLTRYACPVELFVGVLPRYELWFTHVCIPTNVTMALVLGVNRQHTTTPANAAFRETRARLLAALPHQEQPDQSLHMTPIRLRFQFVLPTRGSGDDATTTYETVTVACLTRALELAYRLVVAARKKTYMRKPWLCGRFAVRAFGFQFPMDEVTGHARDLLERIATRIPLFGLTYGTACEQDHDLYGTFLWHVLAPHAPPHSLLGVRKLTLCFNAVHKEEVAAVASAIAQSRSLRELSFTDPTTTQWQDDRHWTAYLGVALFCKNATHQIHTVHLSLHYSNVAEMARVLTEVNPIAYLAGLHDGVPENGVYSQKPLATVRVNPQATITHDMKAHDGAFEILTLADTAHDVECCVAGEDYGDKVRVLAPGIGFCCVPRKDVRSWTTVSPTCHHPVRSLTLRVHASFSVAAVARLLARIGEPLTELTLMNVGERIPEAVPLDGILQWCPHLKRVELSRVTIALTMLVPTRWGQELESLTLRSCEILHGRWQDPVSVSATAFPRLASLYVDVRELALSSTVPAFLLELAVARDLRRLVVLSDDPTHHETYQSHMDTHHGGNIRALPMRHKWALLSVLSVGGSQAKYQLNADVTTRILEMVAPTIRTRICTLL